MLRMQIIGCGAAGNKALISLIESGEIPQDKMSYLLVNSTDKDIKPEYRNNAMIFGNGGSGGCGKERELGKKMILEDEQNGIRNIDSKIDPFADFIVVCGSTEGGSGSASIPIISKYIRQVLHIPVIAVLFFGFNDDVRGMQNSIEICQELEEDIGVISICNSYFLKPSAGNKLLAERAANGQFINTMRAICGIDIHESSQNIDDTDLKKVILTPGYLTVIDHIEFGGSKNIEQYEKRVSDVLDASGFSMESPTKSAKRIALIFNTKEDSEAVDFSGSLFKKRYGTPYELFTHVQDNGYEEDYVTLIVSGQNLPLDRVKKIFEDYKKATSSINKEKDNFFSEMASLRGDPTDSMFNMFSNNRSKETTQADKDAFFKSFGVSSKSDNPPKSDTSRVKDSLKDY